MKRGFPVRTIHTIPVHTFWLELYPAFFNTNYCSARIRTLISWNSKWSSPPCVFPPMSHTHTHTTLYTVALYVSLLQFMHLVFYWVSPSIWSGAGHGQPHRTGWGDLVNALTFRFDKVVYGTTVAGGWWLEICRHCWYSATFRCFPCRSIAKAFSMNCVFVQLGAECSWKFVLGHQFFPLFQINFGGCIGLWGWFSLFTLQRSKLLSPVMSDMHGMVGAERAWRTCNAKASRQRSVGSDKWNAMRSWSERPRREARTSWTEFRVERFLWGSCFIYSIHYNIYVHIFSFWLEGR